MRKKKAAARKLAPKKAVKAAPQSIFQFKIELSGVDRPIWRRIQVADCTLDKLHEHIQTAMGWSNSHLHEFTIKGGRYGDPALLLEDDDFSDLFPNRPLTDSTSTMLSDIFTTSRRLKFRYLYDFGDSWEHEIAFEGNPRVDATAKYPLCLEGERACPPDDVGGIWGFENFLEAMADRKHPEHEDLVDWYGGKFLPERFDSAQATRAMRKGLPDWRNI